MAGHDHGGTGDGHDHGHDHGHESSHGHDHGHGGMCGGLDHHTGDYTPAQRADLDLVLAFNRRMAAAIDAGLDPLETQQRLDPDPLRYMWVDEGQGRLRAAIEAADEDLARAPAIPGHVRRDVRVVEGSRHAARPSVATGQVGGGGVRRLVVWTEWVPDRGELVWASLDGSAPLVVSADVTDVHRPTAVLSANGVPWVLWGASVEGRVGVWASSYAAGISGRSAAWSTPVQVSDSDAPAFNQEAVAHTDGRVELVWQGRVQERFGVFSRTHDGSSWGESVLVTAGVDGNVWDPAVAAFRDGGAAYAWSEYREGAYRVACRRRGPDGTLGEVRPLTGGTDYALHPSLAVTADQRLWAAFDVITVAGHAGSGPTRLRPAAELGADTEAVAGMREAGESVPPELLPEVTAGLRVVEVGDDALRQPSGQLAPRMNVVPSGLPRLVATDDGGLTVAYRVHRQLPLMTYYWEVATQALGPDGWQPPSTFHGTDATLEEVSVAATPGGLVLVAQTDARLERALSWTEGFGGRECPYLLEHHGAVVWHGIHGVGTVVTVDVPAGGAPPTPALLAATVVPEDVHRSDARVEARRWVAGRADPPQERYVAHVGDRDLTLYWGDLHRHSLVSRCTAGDEPSLEDFYRYAWDVCEYDFWAVTDHAENSSDYQWWSIQKIADLFHVPDRFVPLYGFEWTSADTGHQNVIYGDVGRGAPIFSAFADGTTDPAGLWAALEQHPDYPAITIPHHPGSAMVHNDWDFHDPRYSRLVEVFQACRGNYESESCFRQYSDGTRAGTFMVDGLKRGHRFGLIASSDHGHGASYVGAFARSLDRGAVFEALQSRHTFAATTRDVVVELSSGDVFMGEALPPGAPRTFTVRARGYAELARVDLVRDGAVVHSLEPDLGLPAGWLACPLRVEWGEADRTTVWDGAVAVERGGRILPTAYWSPEVLRASETEVAWRATSHSFGEPYGAQRGCVELTVTGPPDALVTLTMPGRSAVLTLAELVDRPEHEVPGTGGRVRLQHGTGGLVGLGRERVELTWTDPAADDAAAFYYARVVQVDGEMAWSSPIWTD